MKLFRRRLQPASLWLAALLFVGQVFAVAHATQHELAAQGSQPACEICIVAHGDGAPPVSTCRSELPQGSDSPVLAALPVRLARPAIDRPRSRAPPRLT